MPLTAKFAKNPQSRKEKWSSPRSSRVLSALRGQAVVRVLFPKNRRHLKTVTFELGSTASLCFPALRRKSRWPQSSRRIRKGRKEHWSPPRSSRVLSELRGQAVVRVLFGKFV